MERRARKLRATGSSIKSEVGTDWAVCVLG